jgi:hypothetical protein
MAGDALARMVAEQVAVDCALHDVEGVLTGSVIARLLPLLRLAGDAGEAAGLVVLGDLAPPSPSRSHELVTSEPQRSGATVCRSFRWRTCSYRTLFEELTGQLDARLAESGVILSVEGVYVPAAGLRDHALGAQAARRAAEATVRAFLGHLRSALEQAGESATSSA